MPACDRPRRVEDRAGWRYVGWAYIPRYSSTHSSSQERVVQRQTDRTSRAPGGKQHQPNSNNQEEAVPSSSLAFDLAPKYPCNRYDRWSTCLYVYMHEPRSSETGNALGALCIYGKAWAGSSSPGVIVMLLWKCS